jgi:hypothetical protein
VGEEREKSKRRACRICGYIPQLLQAEDEEEVEAFV